MEIVMTEMPLQWLKPVSKIPSMFPIAEMIEPEAAAQPTIHCGYGACSKCACVGFEQDVQNHNICSRCGHSYSEHW
jgi:hypothetical protein